MRTTRLSASHPRNRLEHSKSEVQDRLWSEPVCTGILHRSSLCILASHTGGEKQQLNINLVQQLYWELGRTGKQTSWRINMEDIKVN